jgi:hypothetical protein
MDEKGFMIGVTGRLERVLSRLQWESKQLRASLEHGSREWVTVVAAVCADGREYFATKSHILVYEQYTASLMGGRYRS